MNSSMKTFSSLSMKVCVLTVGHREGRGGARGGSHAWLVARGRRFALRAAAPGRPCGREAGGLSAEIWGSGSCSGGGRPAESWPLGVRFLSLPKAAAKYEEESGA